MKGHSRSGLALFFTLGVTLTDWEQSGYLERELSYYRCLAEHVGPITLVTYGGDRDKVIAGRLTGIRVLNNPQQLSSEVFMRHAANLYQSELQGIAIIKSNQIKGAQGVVDAATHTGAQAVVRGGYLLSRFHANKPITLRMRFGLWRREMMLFHRAARIFLPTAEDVQYARRWYSLPTNKVVVMPNFVDMTLFAPRDDVACEPGLIGFVGRLAAQKNLPALIEAVAGIKGARLRLIGDGPDREALASLAQDRGVALEMPGVIPQNELPSLLAECEIFALPSHYEGLPKAMLEAMAAGLPVLATPVQGSGAVIRHRETGWLCEGTSAGALRHGLETLLSDSLLRTRMGRAARRFVEQQFAMETVLAREVAVYREMGLV